MNYYLFFVLITVANLSSYDTKKSKPQTTTQQVMEATNKTIQNMQTAYKGEKTATAKYEAFSKKAETEGFHHIALLYKAVSAAENIHANNHKIVIEDAGSSVPIITPEFEVKSTKENLSDDINGEAYEAKTMYPDFLKAASTAENQLAILSLTYAMKTELKHNKFFEEALADINNNTLNKLPSKYTVCPDCGNTFSIAPNHCDFSFTSKDKFITFE